MTKHHCSLSLSTNFRFNVRLNRSQPGNVAFKWLVYELVALSLGSREYCSVFIIVVIHLELECEDVQVIVNECVNVSDKVVCILCDRSRRVYQAMTSLRRCCSPQLFHTGCRRRLASTSAVTSSNWTSWDRAASARQPASRSAQISLRVVYTVY